MPINAQKITFFQEQLTNKLANESDWKNAFGANKDESLAALQSVFDAAQKGRTSRTKLSLGELKSFQPQSQIQKDIKTYLEHSFNEKFESFYQAKCVNVVNPPIVPPIVIDPPHVEPGTTLPASSGWYKNKGVVADPEKAKIFLSHSQAGDKLNFAGLPALELEGGVKLPAQTFAVTPGALRNYGGASQEGFGRVKFTLGGKELWVPDLAYNLAESGDAKYGMRLIPVADRGEEVKLKDVDGNPVTLKGGEVFDAVIRERDGLKKSDPVWSVLAYEHPESWNNPDGETLAKENLGTEARQTHLGGYLGEAETYNAPETYHGRTFSVSGYPARAFGMNVKGWEKADLNKNAHYAARAMNFDVTFPPDYKSDVYRTIDINTALFFYKNWLILKGGEEAGYTRTQIEAARQLEDDPTWQTYCAEHQSIVAIIAMNVEHSESGFKQVFGDEGKKLFAAFKNVYNKSADSNSHAVWDDATDGLEFSTTDKRKGLWELEGLTQEQIRPWKSFEEYSDYVKFKIDNGAQAKWTSPSGDGWQGPITGAALPWPAETTADLVRDLMVQYFPWERASAVGSISMILGFGDKAAERNGVPFPKFAEITTPFFQKFIEAEALCFNPEKLKGLAAQMGCTPKEAFVKTFKGKLGEALGEKMAVLEQMGLVGKWFASAEKLFEDNGNPKPEVGSMQRPAASQWLHKGLEATMQSARETMISTDNGDNVMFNSPPAIVSRVVSGLVKGNPNVDFYVYGTVMEASELKPGR
ncbi:MAG: hypothetical protein A2341_04745 [Deltaproteobacteria bacterium RIFOXYB12_FULL_58_9]|nr:MAG: hypothetical protein A2341_04745 [Deltaproteobacteria bacterium RIFOXYB12_FULL_58_9]